MGIISFVKKFLLILSFAIYHLLLASPVRAVAQTCPTGESRYRPGGECERTVPSIYTNLNDYPLTCQDIPIANLDGDSISPVLVGDIFTRIITSDISQAELGGLGPNSQIINSYSEDALAQIYPFNGLFDRPISMSGQPREAARTYWRLMNARQQANAKAAYFELVKNSSKTNDNSIEFYNPAKPTVSPTPTPLSEANPAVSDKLGINIGYGHTDPKFGNDAVGRPVTFLVDLGTDEAGLRSYRDLYAGASLRVVRIKNFNASTPESAFSAAGAVYSSVFGDDYVVLGNELNSIDVEYACSTSLTDCGSTYARQFAAFDSAFTGANLSAAPMNTSNPVYDAAKFLDGAKSAYQASTFLANNSYQSPSCAYEAIRCGKESYRWFSQTIGSSAPVILTEYGLAPPDLDRNLTNVLAFYQTLPADVLAITPLIRNVCVQAKGEWLHFNQQNKLVDLDGKTVDPTTCNTSSASGAAVANDSITVLNLARSLPACLAGYPVCKHFAKEYLSLSPTTRNAYDALLPFNFDNIRGYQILNNIIYKENLPYVRAIVDGLNNSRTGLLNLLSPGWMNDLRRQDLYTSPASDGEITPATEVSLKQAIINRNTPAYDPNNCLIHDNSTYLPSPYTYPVNFDESNVKLTQKVDIIVNRVIRELVEDPNTGTASYKYKYSGQKEGLPVIVINSPKLQDLSTSLKGPQSLYALFLPDAGFIPNRDLAAPVALLSSSDNDTKVEGKTFEEGKARIARTAGETQTTLCELRNKWLIPAGLQKAGLNCVDPFQTLGAAVQGPGVSIPIPTEANCDANAHAPTSIGNLLPPDQLLTISFVSGQDRNNLKKCYNDLVNRSISAGYDPAFTMAIWLEESGASLYSSYPDVADFGCAVNTPRNDFNAQVACFLRLKNSYASGSQWKECRGSDDQLSLHEFFLIFEGGYQSCRAGEFTIEPQFPDRIKNYYSLVTGGKTLNFSAPPP